jgi:hypothetical protein
MSGWIQAERRVDAGFRNQTALVNAAASSLQEAVGHLCDAINAAPQESASDARVIRALDRYHLAKGQFDKLTKDSISMAMESLLS